MSDLKLAGLPTPSIDSKVPSLRAGMEDKKLRDAAQQFEGIFLDMVMKTMLDTTVMESDVMGNSQHTKMYQSLLDTEYAKGIGQSGRLGIADKIVQQLSRQKPENPL